MHEAKKAAFNAAEKKRLALQKENAIMEREKLQKQATDREKKNADRHARLIDAYRGRQERRNDTLRRSKEKDKNFEKVGVGLNGTVLCCCVPMTELSTLCHLTDISGIIVLLSQHKD